MGVVWDPMCACICLYKEEESQSKDYVDISYTREKCLLAYGQFIEPMPRVKHWDKVNLPQPLPPRARRMTGRPSLKKRKKEAGEDGQLLCFFQGRRRPTNVQNVAD